MPISYAHVLSDAVHQLSTVIPEVIKKILNDFIPIITPLIDLQWKFFEQLCLTPFISIP
jgi:hypothetical protein